MLLKKIIDVRSKYRLEEYSQNTFYADSAFKKLYSDSSKKGHPCF